MTPYADSLYFGLLLYPAVVSIALGIAGRLSWRWVFVINAAMLAVQYAGVLIAPPEPAPSKIWVVAVYALFHWGLAISFLRIRGQTNHKAVFRIVLLLALTPLLIIKVMPGVAPASYVGFIGISYVTFRGLDVIICIQDRLIKTLPPASYLAYLLFFPAVSSGPIDRYNRFVSEFRQTRTRQQFLQDLDGAVQRIFRGLLYKFIVAALIEKYWLAPASSQTGVLHTTSYMYAYTLHLFFDFAGYSAFAIGVGYLLGIHTPENFNRPFWSKDIVDFWNRWHMSLSTWFRDHVYMRFVMAATRGRWFASRLTMSCVAFYVSFGLMGLWHGLALRYIVYGLYHATLLAAHTVLTSRRKPASLAVPSSWQLVNVVVTFHLVSIGFLIFSGRLG